MAKPLIGKPEIAELSRHFRRFFSDMIGIIEVEVGQPCDLCSTRGHLQH